MGAKTASLTLHLKTKYDLATQADTMLEYQIDTFGGECSFSDAL